MFGVNLEQLVAVAVCGCNFLAPESGWNTPRVGLLGKRLLPSCPASAIEICNSSPRPADGEVPGFSHFRLAFRLHLETFIC